MLRSRSFHAAAVFLLGVFTLTWFLLRTDAGQRTLVIGGIKPEETPAIKEEERPPHPQYKPTPTYTPPTIKDPFPALATSTPPPIPSYNVPEKDGWKKYDLEVAPPLLIGFTRTWPMLLQTVVSYITAGWPADQIYVVENTGMQQANARGQLTLQHPWYLNHTTLERLGVHVVQTPVLLTFAQLQNFYLSLSYEHGWPYYFWSHMDVLALSHEDGLGDSDAARAATRAGQPGYKSLYTLCLEELNRTSKGDSRWALRFFAYDHLTLQNPRALEDVGGWDTMIPYYMTDCDMYSRLHMRKWSQNDANCGIITDTSAALEDLRALYRDPTVTPRWVDPNPPPPPPPDEDEESEGEGKGEGDEVKGKREERGSKGSGDGGNSGMDAEASVKYWYRLRQVSDEMFQYKHSGRGRNTWQEGQRGGQGEPFYYDSLGFGEALVVLIEAGKEVFRQKWGHGDCNLIDGGGLGFDDQWKVLKDF